MAKINPKDLEVSLIEKYKENNPAKSKRIVNDLEITIEMHRVRDMYWCMKNAEIDATPATAALQCDIRPAKIESWFEDKDIKLWFHTEPVNIRVTVNANNLMAARVGRDLLNAGDPAIKERFVRYSLDQAVGKSTERNKNDTEDPEEDDSGLDDDIRKLEKLERKLGKAEQVCTIGGE